MIGSRDSKPWWFYQTMVTNLEGPSVSSTYPLIGLVVSVGLGVLSFIVPSMTLNCSEQGTDPGSLLGLKPLTSYRRW